jgi:hypothetical protein
MAVFVVCKWTGKPPKQAYLSGAKQETNYTAAHVNAIERMLVQTQKSPPQLICVTDDPEGLNSSIRTYPIAKAGLDFIDYHGGRFFKLFMFSEEFQQFIGQRFIYLDLDVAICSDVSDLIQEGVDLVIMRGVGSQRRVGIRTFAANFVRTGSFQAALRPKVPWCKFNSSFMAIAPGVGHQLWSQFDSKQARKLIEKANLIGTDQAWLHLQFPGTVKTVGQAEGVWRFPQVDEVFQRDDHLPKNLKLIAFAGKPEKKPWVTKMREVYPWICKVYPELL